MYTVHDWYKAIDSFAPFETAMAFDNCGLQVGDFRLATDRALIALDLTAQVIDEAVGLGIGLIITHHPALFHPIKQLHTEDLVYRLAAQGIALISAHTNLDIAEGGVNDALARRLNLANVRPFVSDGLGRLGDLPQAMSPRDFALQVKTSLGATGVRLAAGKQFIQTVAVCGGSGGDLIVEALSAGAQVLVTGEAKHHELLQAQEIDVSLVDAGHYFTEAVVIEPLAERLRGLLSGAEVVVSRQSSDGVMFL
jgi:dinuclear metal center YbgI/SA1388 family protein